MPEWICLPRGINLGSVNKVNMPQLRKALAAAGFDDVRSYLQSGRIAMKRTCGGCSTAGPGDVVPLAGGQPPGPAAGGGTTSPVS